MELPDLTDELDLLLEPDEEPSPLDFPPTPPAEEEPLRVIEPVEDVDVFGLTTDPVTCLFWKLPLLYVGGL